MFNQRMRIVSPARVTDPYAPSKSGRLSFKPEDGATVHDEVYMVSCQPANTAEEDDTGRRVTVATSWNIITRPGQMLTDIRPSDGVIVDGIDGVLQVDGEVGHWPWPPLDHSEFVVTRWKG